MLSSSKVKFSSDRQIVKIWRKLDFSFLGLVHFSFFLFLWIGAYSYSMLLILRAWLFWGFNSKPGICTKLSHLSKALIMTSASLVLLTSLISEGMYM